MLFNFKESMRKRRELVYSRIGILNEGKEWDKDILLNVLLLGALKQNDSMYNIKDAMGYDSESIDVKLTINGIELDLEKGLERVLRCLDNPLGNSTFLGNKRR